MDKCSHVCSKSGKPCQSNGTQELNGVKFCAQHKRQHEDAPEAEVPDIFAVKEKE